jgi:hypothetical protein
MSEALHIADVYKGIRAVWSLDVRSGVSIYIHMSNF